MELYTLFVKVDEESKVVTDMISKGYEASEITPAFYAVEGYEVAKSHKDVTEAEIMKIWKDNALKTTYYINNVIYQVGYYSLEEQAMIEDLLNGTK